MKLNATIGYQKIIFKKNEQGEEKKKSQLDLPKPKREKNQSLRELE